MQPHSEQVSGYFYALLTATLWSLIGSISRLCFAEGVTPFEVAFWRAALGGLCFVIHAACTRQLMVPVRHALFFSGFGVIGISVFFSVFLISVKEGGAALAVVLMYTAPAWVAIFSRILFHEIISPRKILALGIAMLGTVLVSFSGGSLSGQNATLGILCGLAAGFTYALHYPFYVWWKDRYSTATLYAYMLVSGSLALLPFVHFAPHKSFTTWMALLSLGLVTNYGAYLAYGQGLRRISPVRAAVVSNLEPVLGTFLAWLFWNEMFPPIGWTGTVCVMGAVFLLTTDKNTQ